MAWDNSNKDGQSNYPREEADQLIQHSTFDGREYHSQSLGHVVFAQNRNPKRDGSPYKHSKIVLNYGELIKAVNSGAIRVTSGGYLNLDLNQPFTPEQKAKGRAAVQQSSGQRGNQQWNNQQSGQGQWPQQQQPVGQGAQYPSQQQAQPQAAPWGQQAPQPNQQQWNQQSAPQGQGGWNPDQNNGGNTPF